MFLKNNIFPFPLKFAPILVSQLHKYHTSLIVFRWYSVTFRIPPWLFLSLFNGLFFWFWFWCANFHCWPFCLLFVSRLQCWLNFISLFFFVYFPSAVMAVDWVTLEIRYLWVRIHTSGLYVYVLCVHHPVQLHKRLVLFWFSLFPTTTLDQW